MQAKQPDDRWIVREWEDGAVVYDRHTGDTHALDALSAELLALAQESRSSAALAAQALAAFFDFSPGSDWAERVSLAFDHLHRIELI